MSNPATFTQDDLSGHYSGKSHTSKKVYFSSFDTGSVVCSLMKRTIVALEGDGVKCTCFQRDSIPGRLRHDNIKSLTSESEVVVIFLCKDYIRDRFCNYEAAMAVYHQKEIIVLKIEEDCEIPDFIHAKHCIDASQNDDNAIQELLRVVETIKDIPPDVDCGDQAVQCDIRMTQILLDLEEMVFLDLQVVMYETNASLAKAVRDKDKENRDKLDKLLSTRQREIADFINKIEQLETENQQLKSKLRAATAETSVPVGSETVKLQRRLGELTEAAARWEEEKQTICLAFGRKRLDMEEEKRHLQQEYNNLRERCLDLEVMTREQRAALEWMKQERHDLENYVLQTYDKVSKLYTAIDNRIHIVDSDSVEQALSELMVYADNFANQQSNIETGIELLSHSLRDLQEGQRPDVLEGDTTGYVLPIQEQSSNDRPQMPPIDWEVLRQSCFYLCEHVVAEPVVYAHLLSAGALDHSTLKFVQSPVGVCERITRLVEVLAAVESGLDCLCNALEASSQEHVALELRERRWDVQLQMMVNLTDGGRPVPGLGVEETRQPMEGVSRPVPGLCGEQTRQPMEHEEPPSWQLPTIILGYQSE